MFLNIAFSYENKILVKKFLKYAPRECQDSCLTYAALSLEFLRVIDVQVFSMFFIEPRIIVDSRCYREWCAVETTKMLAENIEYIVTTLEFRKDFDLLVSSNRIDGCWKSLAWVRETSISVLYLGERSLMGGVIMNSTITE